MCLSVKPRLFTDKLYFDVLVRETPPFYGQVVVLMCLSVKPCLFVSHFDAVALKVMNLTFIINAFFLSLRFIAVH